MKTQILRALLALSVFILTSSQACAGLKNGTITLTSGNWKVLRDKDPMTDKTECTGIYLDNYGIQLTADKLYISVSGGLQSVTLRFGDEPARPLRFPTDLEKTVRVIILSGAELEQLQAVSRLRYQALTLVSGIKAGDLDLTGLKPVLDNIRAGCPVQASVPATPISKDTLTDSVCDAVLTSRMWELGLKESQITARSAGEAEPLHRTRHDCPH